MTRGGGGVSAPSFGFDLPHFENLFKGEFVTQAIPNLANLDIEFLLDRSGSMLTKDCAGGKKTRRRH